MKVLHTDLPPVNTGSLVQVVKMTVATVLKKTYELAGVKTRQGRKATDLGRLVGS